jgi:hypothetical protein
MELSAIIITAAVVSILANAPKAWETISKAWKFVSSRGHTLYQGV